jgi:hypothetical protein
MWSGFPRSCITSAHYMLLGDFNSKRCNFHGGYAESHLFTDGTPEKVQHDCTSTLSNESPNARVTRFPNVSRRLLQLEYPLRSCRTPPFHTEWHQYLNHVTSMGVNDCTALFGLYCDIWCWCCAHYHVARASVSFTVSHYCT